jgi:flavin reductase (DIM6/NTAB) family NADH-FMN oxidoreductase RutF
LNFGMASTLLQDRFDTIDPELMSRAENYKLLTGSVIPRPIAFVTTLNSDGSVNAAPFSQFIIISTQPGMLAFSSGEGKWGTKDTVVNARRNGEFVISTVPEDMARVVQDCAQELPRNASEAELFGIELIASEVVRTPRIAASHVQFECTLERIVEFGDGPNSLVVGRVRRMHVRHGLLLEGGKIDHERYQPIGRIAGRRYCTFGRIIDL